MFRRSTVYTSTALRLQMLVLIRLDVIGLLRAMKNILGVSRVIRLNKQIKRSQATSDCRKHCPSIFI